MRALLLLLLAVGCALLFSPAYLGAPWWLSLFGAWLLGVQFWMSVEEYRDG
jgi:hypothetical protein